MRVICCYTGRIHPRAADALKRFAPDCEYVETRGLYGYGEAIAERWTGESDLVIIEGDKVITEEVLPSFERCNRHWCTYQYDIFPPPCTRTAFNGLGCTKYSALVQQVITPEESVFAHDVNWEPCRQCDSRGCYRYIDSRINRALERHGHSQQPHIHGEIEHVHEYGDSWFKRNEEDWEYYNSKIPEMRIDPDEFEPVGNELCV